MVKLLLVKKIVIHTSVVVLLQGLGGKVNYQREDHSIFWEYQYWNFTIIEISKGF